MTTHFEAADATPTVETTGAIPGSSRARVLAAYERLAAVDRDEDEIFIYVRPLSDALADAARVDASIAEGRDLPLAAMVIAVKDNIDVAGAPTTAACPDYSYQPSDTALSVERLLDAGAVWLGKTNLDQFATGLVGTRSPYGAVRNAWMPGRVSGGSSSGSAVAVALGIVDVGVGTDTAGSGRVPAAFQRIVGIKPTLGLVPTAGVVPAASSYDCVTAFARDLRTAELAVDVMTTGPGPQSQWPPDAPLGAPATPIVAVPNSGFGQRACG